MVLIPKKIPKFKGEEDTTKCKMCEFPLCSPTCSDSKWHTECRYLQRAPGVSHGISPWSMQLVGVLRMVLAIRYTCSLLFCCFKRKIGHLVFSAKIGGQSRQSLKLTSSSKILTKKERKQHYFQIHKQCNRFSKPI